MDFEALKVALAARLRLPGDEIERLLVDALATALKDRLCREYADAYWHDGDIR